MVILMEMVILIYYILVFNQVLEKISELREFDPTSNNYVKSSFDIGEIVDADVEFGDIDGDGDLDFVLSGTIKKMIIIIQ